jgi:hypothetical protein
LINNLLLKKSCWLEHARTKLSADPPMMAHTSDPLYTDSRDLALPSHGFLFNASHQDEHCSVPIKNHLSVTYWHIIQKISQQPIYI